MTGKEAREHLDKVLAEGAAEGWVEGQEGKQTRGQIWSILSREVDDHKRGERLPTDLAKRIREAYPDTSSAEPVVEAAQG